MSVPPPITAAGAPRPRTEVRLICLDLDGTCIESSSQYLDDRTARAVAAVAAHIPVMVVTGRMYRSATPWAERLGATGPLICYQGALIQAPPAAGRAGEILWEQRLPRTVCRHGLEEARRHDWHRQAFVNDTLYAEQDREELRFYADIAQVPTVVVPDLETVMEDGLTKFICVIRDHVQARRAEARMAEVLGADARVTSSLPEYIEITDPVATKARSVERVCRMLGISPEAVVAIGDAPNDADMLQTVGFGVVVEGAREPALSAAVATCPGPRSAGVAVVLSSLGLVPENVRPL